MDTIRKGLRAGDVEKDTYERLICAHCGETLDTRSDAEEIGKVRRCPGCGREWKQLS